MCGAVPEPALERLLRGFGVAAAVAAIVTFAVLATWRVPYPFELEWMEGAMVDHAARVLHGQGVYVAPGPQHVAFLYTPLLYWLGALLMPVCGESFLALRLVGTLAAVACAVLVAALARAHGADRERALVAAGLFAAGHGYLCGFFDLARNDTLFLAGVLATALLLRRDGWRPLLAAGGTATLAFLAKQTALMWLPALAVMALLLDWRRGLRFGVVATAGIGTAVLLLHLASDGWSTFFVFEMPRGHAIVGENKLAFFTRDLRPLLPMLAGGAWLLVRLARTLGWRPGLAAAAFAGGGLLASYLSRLHAGGYDNVLMYGFAAGCVLLPALPAAATGRGPRLLAQALLLLQFALLVLDVRDGRLGRLVYDPAAMLPTAAHRQASEELVAFVRAAPGPVVVPFHGHVAALAGKPPSAHGQALFDIVQRFLRDQAEGGGSARSQAAFAALQQGYAATFAAGALLLLEPPHGEAFEKVFQGLLTGYRRRPGVPLPHGADLQPVTGMVTHSPYVLEPAR